MNREIKFRAWDKINNKWVSVADLDKEIIVNPYTSTSRSGQFSISEWNAVHRVAEDIGTTIVLMQYTGLKDKNGKEIYEGDIICVTSDVWCSNNEPLLVVWTGHFAGYGLKRKGFDFAGKRNCYPTCLSGVMGSPKCEVIGNIHENPELLEAKC